MAWPKLTHASLRKCPISLVRALRTVRASIENMKGLRSLSLYVASVAFALAFAGCGGAVAPPITTSQSGAEASSGTSAVVGSPSSSGSAISSGPTPSGPSTGGGPGASSSGLVVGASGSVFGPPPVSSSPPSVPVPPPPTPVPPTCNFPLPDICEVCPSGETECAHYAIQNGQCVTEICPPESPPPPPTPMGCTQGASCPLNSGCGGGPTALGACTTSCLCDPTGHLQCTTTCPPPPIAPPCAQQGATCTPGTGCGTAEPAGFYGCETSCNCDATGHFQCNTVCPDVDASVPPPVPVEPCAGLPLPQYCLMCSDGGLACAHYVLNAVGQCQIETCP